MPHSGYTICTSEQRLTSTAVSHGFIIARYSSPPFGSHGPCNHSEPCPLDCGTGAPCRDSSGVDLPSPCTLGLAEDQPTCKLHRLLGPCFKTGREWHCLHQAQLPSDHARSGGPAATQEPPSEWCSHHAATSPSQDQAQPLACPKTHQV